MHTRIRNALLLALTVILGSGVAVQGAGFHAQAAGAKPGLAAAQARAAASDAVLDQLGGNGTLERVSCKRSGVRKYTCRSAGTMWGANQTEHEFTAKVKVQQRCAKPASCRVTASVTFAHVATTGGTTGDAHAHAY